MNFLNTIKGFTTAHPTATKVTGYVAAGLATAATIVLTLRAYNKHKANLEVLTAAARRQVVVDVLDKLTKAWNDFNSDMKAKVSFKKWMSVMESEAVEILLGDNYVSFTTFADAIGENEGKLFCIIDGVTYTSNC